MAKGKMPALRHTLGNAPTTPHWVDGVAGFYRSDKPTPVGGPGEVSVERAGTLDGDAGVPLELVQVTAAEAAELRDYWGEVRRLAQRAIRDFRAHADGAEVDQVNDEAAAASGKEG